MSKVYIVLVNYKGYKDTIECLESVFKSTYENYQIIIIDNSPDNLSEQNLVQWMNNEIKIETVYPEFIYPLVQKPINFVCIQESDFLSGDLLYEQRILLIKANNNGFAAANNIALRYIQKKADQDSFIWLLNNDTVVKPDCIKHFVDYFKINGNDYVLGAKLMFYQSKTKIQAVAGRYNKWLGSTHHIGEGEIDEGQYENYIFHDNDYVVGASMFLPKAFIDTVGLMSEDYFLYFEELDWGLKSHQLGFKFALQSKAVVYHKEGASIIKNNNSKNIADFYSMVNRIKFTKKWFHKNLFLVTCTVVFALIKRLAKGRFTIVKQTIPAVIKVLFA